MKAFKTITALALAGVFAASPIIGFAADGKDKETKAKPYPLKTCAVSDEKFGGDMGEPYVFVYKGQEIKLCCKSCKKDFDKEPAKYLSKIEKAAKKDKKS